MEIFLLLLAGISAQESGSRVIKSIKSPNCGQDLLVEYFCYKECPDGYDQKGTSCIQSSSMIFSLKFFSKIEYQRLNEENWNCYAETPHESAPATTEKRGVFISSSSSMCATKNKFLFGPKLMIVFWIRLFRQGNVFRTSDASLTLTVDKFDDIEFSINMSNFSIENKVKLTDQWMRISCKIDFSSYDFGVAALILDDQESRITIENSNIPYKNTKNQLIFGDFLQNNQGFIGFIYQVSGFIDLQLNLPHLEISDCNINFLDSSCESCNQESCIEDCCSSKLGKKRRNQSYYLEINNTQFTVTTCPTYYYLNSNNQCVWNSSVLEFSFYNNKSTFKDSSGNVQLSPFSSLPSFSQSRGLYYDGASTGFSIPGMTLSPDFTVVMWFNPYQTTAMQLLDKWLKLSICMNSMKIGIYLNRVSYYSTITLSNGTWYEGIFTVIAGNWPIGMIVINRLQTYVVSIPYANLISGDLPSINFQLGRVFGTNRFFKGWIAYFLYSPYHTGFASMTFYIYSVSQLLLNECYISNYYNYSSCWPCSSGGVLDSYGQIYNTTLNCEYSINICNNVWFCNDNFYWNGTTCLKCYSSCSICNGPLASDCLLNTDSGYQNYSIGHYSQSSTCGRISIKSFFDCDPSCLTCTGSKSNNCTSCMQNATLQSNGTCSCSQGWSGTPPLCTRNNFSAVLSINASDVGKIVFSEPLGQQLSDSDFLLLANKKKQNFSIVMIDISSYYVDVVFDQNITQNNELEILFSANIVSKTNSLLITSSLKAALYPHTLGGIQECFESIYDNCYTCAASMTLCTTICYCNNNFYWDGTSCSACDSSCSICNGPLPSDCLLKTVSNKNFCKDGYFFHSDTCDSATFYNCFPCDPSCFDCIGPALNDCTSCMQNATLQSNGTCSCSQGWSGVPPACVRIYFNAFLSVNANDEATIIFSEPLAYELNNSNVNVFVNSVSQNFSMKMIDESTWFIEPVYLEDISENSNIEILILGYIVSEKNSLLWTSKLSSVLYPIKSQILAQQVLVQQLATVKATTQQAATASGAVLGSVSLLNLNVIFLFQFLNAAEMFNIVQFFNMDLDPLFLQFVSTLQSSFKLPSVFDYFINSNDGVAIPIKYQNLGFSTNLIMINSGTNLTIFLALLMIVIILFTIKIIMRLFKKNIKTINKSLVLRIFTWFWIQTIFDLTINSIVGVYLVKFENITQILDFGCCIFVLVIYK